MDALISGLKNKNTTALGIGAILVAVGGVMVALFDGDPATKVDWVATGATLAAGLSGVGNIFSKDGKTGSQP